MAHIRKKISVITCTFNLIKGQRQDVFIEMFKSVHSQTYPNIEHLIIDGGSKDGTIEFINKVNQKYGKKQLVIFSEPDKGITDATNKGVRKSTGDYVILMPSDDYYMCNNALELLVNTLETQHCDFVCGNGWWQFKSIWRANLNSFTYRHPFMITTMLIKKDLFKNKPFFDPKLRLVADYELFFRLLTNPNITGVALHKTLTALRPGGASQSNQDLFIKETVYTYKKYFNKKCNLKKFDILSLHWRFPSDEVFKKILQNETNERILSSIKKLYSYRDQLGPLFKGSFLKRCKKLILNLIFLKFIFRPLKRMLGIEKNKVKFLDKRFFLLNVEDENGPKIHQSK